MTENAASGLILSDQAERDLFIREHGRNISVIAPAGVGKTFGIVQRILHLAQLPEVEAVDRLSRLVVVTYSVRAAQEMQQRARTEIRRAKLSPKIQRAFQQTFFGTIHSFCVQLLARFGHYLGLPATMNLPPSEDELWNRFLIHGLRHDGADAAPWPELFHFYTVEQLYGLGKIVSPGPEINPAPLPLPDITRLIGYRAEGLHPATRKALGKSQAALKLWQEAWARGDRFHPLPAPPQIKALDFLALWTEIFAPLQNWLRAGAYAFGRQVANRYETFRLAEGIMTYDDQVRVALRVLENDAVRRELEQDRVSVLLDEAQDTDLRQFDVLLRVAGLKPEPNQAQNQTFCIVGDFQQAIWAPRSDLAVYQAVHNEISAEPRGLVSRLHVTFRCDHTIIDFVNQVFDRLLDASDGQAQFERLRARDGAGPGQVVRWVCPPTVARTPGKKLVTEDCAQEEANFIASEIARLGPAGLGADRWQDVAILCPRRNWLQQIRRELLRLGVPAQLHSGRETLADSVPRTWFTALVWVAAHPEDSFEIAGVLRDVFGVSDHDMALYTGGDGALLRLDRFGEGTGAVHNALAILHHACAGLISLPLDLAVRQLVERTRLRDRLVSLQDEHAVLIGQELDEAIAFVDQRAAEGATLGEVASELRDALSQVSLVEEEVRDAVQLCTSHKAKGLEWQTVIVPFLFRAIDVKPPRYPRLVTGPKGEELYRDRAGFDAEAKEFVTRRELQQFQRLLYVTCTRPRHTLLFIDDENAFQDLPRRGLSTSARLLCFDEGEHRAVWKALPETLIPKPASDRAPVIPDEIIPPSPPLTPDDLEKARASANRIPRRVTPHALADHASADEEPERRLEREDEQVARTNPGILYGTWWHQMMESMPWSQPRDVWQERFAHAQKLSPQPERASSEWALFLDSGLARALEGPGLLIYHELPFLWPENDERCLEGVMDLTVYSSTERMWRVIDWKTNRVGNGGRDRIVAIYRPQIEAYVRALRAILQVEVRGSLYLTATGDWIEL
jgi:ATP-dependent helicase/nuclease subunit A